ncbi:MAG: hypothetical protein VX768_12315 [Planctomycetota bacterium]|nr:hypothetical protein [Planctomycetota bacterium]
MSEQNRRFLCRLLFLTTCIGPTLLQLWIIFGPESRDLQIPGETRTLSLPARDPVSSEPEIDWLKHQGITRPGKLPGVRATQILREHLPLNHLLQRFGIEKLRIHENPTELVLEMEDGRLALKDLESLWEAVGSEDIESCFDLRRTTRVQFRKLVLVSDDASEWFLELRNLEMTRENRKEPLVIRANVVAVTTADNREVEYPFELRLEGDHGNRSITWQGSHLPVRLFGHFADHCLGSQALFSGGYRRYRDEGRLTQVFEGDFIQVNCESLGRSFARQSGEIASGPCKLVVRRAEFLEGNLTQFSGHLQSTSTGVACNRLAGLLGAEVEWVADKNVASYGSFYLDLEYAQGRLQISSGFGGPLVWDSQGRDLLRMRAAVSVQ